MSAFKHDWDWHCKYLFRDWGRPPKLGELPPALAVFLWVTAVAKTHHAEIVGEYIYIRYVAKRHKGYRSSRLQLAAALKKAFRVAHDNGVEARLMR